MAVLKLVFDTGSSAGNVELVHNGKNEVMFQTVPSREVGSFWLILNKDDWEEAKRFVESHFNSE